MIRWLCRYVKQINVFGVGIELREIPAEEALVLLSANPQPAPSQPSAGQGGAAAPIVRREDYVCVSGTSPSSNGSPREIDLMIDGDEIQFHIHQPGGSQPKLWVSRKVLEEAFAGWKQTGASAKEITVSGRTARKDGEVKFVFDDSDVLEVQAGWWIWVGKKDLEAALQELGVHAPW